MIPHREAQRIGAELLRHLYKKMALTEECKFCGCSPMTASEAGVLRQLLKDNQTYAVAEEVQPSNITKSAGPVAFPVQSQKTA